MSRKFALLGLLVAVIGGLLLSVFLGGSFDPKYNDWIVADDFVENLSANPSTEEINNVIALSRLHEHWIVRRDAADYLGHIGGHSAILFLISMIDSNQSVKTTASDWLWNASVQDLKYRLDRDMTNPFGQTWNPLGSVTAVIAAIDETTSQTIGLTAMQMSNLSVETAAGFSIVTSTQSLKIYTFYNAFGEQASGGAGIRISKDLAEQLHIGIGDSITLVSEGGTSVVPA